MKKIIILLFIVLSFVSCANTTQFTCDNDLPAKEFIDKKITKTPVIIDGHNYIFFEYGTRGKKNYAFELEHAMECKKCYDIFD